MAPRDRGAFTAELAAALPALVLMLLVGLTAVSGLVTKLRCVDAAREGALAAARGEDGHAAGRRQAPAGATITLRRSGDRAVVEVSAPVRAFGARLPMWTVAATAVAAVEPDGAAVDAPGAPDGVAVHGAPAGSGGALATGHRSGALR